MRNLKKFLALVLAMMMVMSLMLTVNATSFEDDDKVETKFAEAVDVLTGIGIIKGFDNDGVTTFDPQGKVTRAQMAAFVYRIATNDAEEKQAHLYAGSGTRFTDVAEGAWYDGVVGYCADREIIVGYGDGTFRPWQEVTGTEALVMILRAVGYDQGKEFQGSAWAVNAYSRANDLKLLVNVDNTNYKSTLSDVATRELVAELLFQAGRKPTVTWTQALGYNDGSSTLLGPGTPNKSLLEKNYYLAEHTGIIVGNQETGESGTIVAKTDPIEYIKKGETDPSKTDAPTGYEYPGTELIANGAIEAGSGNCKDDGGDEYVGTEAITFTGVSSGLDQYGHKVKIWYNSNNNKAYSFVDKAKAVTVYASETVANDELNIADATKGIGKAAKAAGFDMNKAADLQWSSEYSVFTKGDAVTAASPIHMYTLIDNTGNGKVDAIIRLNAEVAQIIETNTTAKPKTISLGGVTGSASTAEGSSTGVLFAEAVSGTNVNQIVAGSTTTLGAVVTAWQVTGTYQDDDIAVKGYNKTAPAPQASDLWKLVSPLKTVTGTITSYTLKDKADNTSAVVNITVDGKKIERSGILEGSQAIAFCADDTAPAGTDIAAGATYTITLDSLGRFVGISAPNSYGFVYATYADFQDGGLGSASIDYKVYGVDWNGSKIVDRDLTWMSIDGTDYGPNEGDGQGLGDGYKATAFELNKKDMATNQVVRDHTQGFMLSTEGELQDATGCETNKIDMGGYQMADGDVWSFKTADANNGFAKVQWTNPDGDKIDLMISNETEFIVVTGIGSNMVVKTYTGIKELLDGNTSAVIGYADDGVAASKNEVWFQTENYAFDKLDTAKNDVVTKVILTDGNLKHFNVSNLYFSAPSNTDPTGVKLAGNKDANQFKLWTAEGEGTYFLTNANLKAKTFYTLSKVGESSGQNIYTATEVTATTSPKLGTPGDGGDCNVDVTYEYIVVNNLNKAQIGTDIFDVSNAVVVDVEYGIDDDPATNLERNEIDSVLKLNNAVSTKTNDIVVAVVNDGINATVIYVIKTVSP